MTRTHVDAARKPREPRGVRSRRWWADLSLRTRLLLFALGLVTVPGVVFALVAFSGTRAALEREVGIQLQQTAERGADAVAAVVEQARRDARAWARQDVMRDLLVGDLDKRVARFLSTVTVHEAAYLAVVCTDGGGDVVAASHGEWMGRNLDAWPVTAALRAGTDVVVGPVTASELGREVLQVGAPIRNPDPPGERIGSLILVYDWDAVRAQLDDIRVQLRSLDKQVAAAVVDPNGSVIGGVSFDGAAAQRSPLAAQRWQGFTDTGYGKRPADRLAESGDGVLIGATAVPNSPQGWSVLFIESAAEALAPVHRVRQRWMAVIAGILAVGLAAAAVLARQVMQPLDEVTRATTALAARPDVELPLLPVHSRNEVGQLTESFNRMTIEVRRSRDEALSAAKFAFAGELAAMVAHEVRTPLTVMRSSAQLLANGRPPGSATIAELVETIVAEVDRVERVVTGLIQLARPLEHRLEPTSLRDLLSRAADFAAAKAAQNGIRISCDFVDDGPPAWCDGEQMYQVVLNLVVNALQALSPGGSIHVRTLAADSGTVGFAVADDGPGLPEEIREQVFQPFVTGREDGTGLGLAFVDRVVKAHRGHLSVRSETGKGTVFEIRLPVAEAGK
jgi:signal transduction histidine kinase